jgi:hypothetical protein
MGKGAAKAKIEQQKKKVKLLKYKWKKMLKK